MSKFEKVQNISQKDNIFSYGEVKISLLRTYHVQMLVSDCENPKASKNMSPATEFQTQL